MIRSIAWLTLAASLVAGAAAGDQPPPVRRPASEPKLQSPLDGEDGRDLSVRHYDPRPMLRTPDHSPGHPAHPVIDVHTHLYFKLRDNAEMLDDYVRLMDQHHIVACVSLDGRLDAWLDSHHRFLTQRHPERFAVMAHLNWVGDGREDDPQTWSSNRQGWGERMADAIRTADDRKQIVGLKIFKRFGLGHRSVDGSLVTVDDPKLDPIWQACAERGLPVLMHTGDPAAFFEPADRFNERWEELSRHPSWSFHGDDFPSREQLFEARCRLWQRHPKTTFIAAHMANNPEDLDRVGQWLHRYPNVNVELASRISELGRQPRRARRFLIEHADRVMFGTDGPWPGKRLSAYWRFLETADENFDYSEKRPPPQGLWRIDGVDLPDDVLQKIYYRNAVRLMPQLADAVADWQRRPTTPAAEPTTSSLPSPTPIDNGGSP